MYDDQHTYVAKAGSLVNTPPPKKENVQTDVKIDEVTQSDADLAKAAAQWKKQKEEKTANVTKTAVKAANTTVKAKAECPNDTNTTNTTVSSKAQVKVEAKANQEIKCPNDTNTTNVTASVKVQVKANATDFVDPKPFPNPNAVPLAKANKGDTPEKKKTEEAAPEAAAAV